MWNTDCRSELQASLHSSPAAVHEFRIPPKALLGLHSYCPVHFDAFHVVLVDVSIHVSLLKAGSHTPSSKVPRSVADSSSYYRHAGHNHTYVVTSLLVFLFFYCFQTNHLCNILVNCIISAILAAKLLLVEVLMDLVEYVFTHWMLVCNNLY